MTTTPLLKALQVYNATLEQLEKSEDNVQKALEQLKRFAGASTFNIEGKFYQLRKRKNSYYLCELSGKPRGRPKGVAKIVEAKPLPTDVLDVAELSLLERAVEPQEPEAPQEPQEPKELEVEVVTLTSTTPVNGSSASPH